MNISEKLNKKRITYNGVEEHGLSSLDYIYQLSAYLEQFFLISQESKKFVSLILGCSFKRHYI